MRNTTQANNQLNNITNKDSSYLPNIRNRTQNNSSNEWKATTRCYNCQEIGHISKECQKRNEQSQQREWNNTVNNQNYSNQKRPDEQIHNVSKENQIGLNELVQNH
jgi:hypothetical protein